MTTTDLEEAFRAGLQRHAEDVDTTVDLLGPAQAAARGRRRRRWVASAAIGLAAAALVTAVVVQAPAAVRRSGPAPAWSTRDRREPMPDRVAHRGLARPGGRGAGRLGVGDRARSRCRSTSGRRCCAAVRRDGAGERDALVNPDRDEPWVGRPVMLSDDCLGRPFPAPTAPYVWLGADLAPGTVDVGDGYVQETVEVDGTTLTVAARDPATAATDPGLRWRRGRGLRAVPGQPRRSSSSMLIEGLRDPSVGAGLRLPARTTGTAAFDLVYATDARRGRGDGVPLAGLRRWLRERTRVLRRRSTSACWSRSPARTPTAAQAPRSRQDDRGRPRLPPGLRRRRAWSRPLSDEGHEPWSRNGAAGRRSTA